MEIDSAWFVVLAVSLVTLPAALFLRKLIKKPGGFYSGLLLSLPLVVPLAVAFHFRQALLPEFARLRPVKDAMMEGSTDLLHLLALADGSGTAYTPYAFSGSAGPWFLLIALAVVTFMLGRRMLGTILIRRLIMRSREPEGEARAKLSAGIERLVASSRLKQRPEVLLLPQGVFGAFAVGARKPHILICRDLVEELDERELEGILAHEVAHIEARDIPLVFTSGVLRDLAAWNPLAHMAYRKLRRDREFEADRRAAALTSDPLSIASGLLRVCELGTGRKRTLRTAALGAFRPGGTIAPRVDRLLAAADGRVSLGRAGNLQYIVAAAMVAVLGFQVGAQLVERDSGAFVIVWGAPATTTSEELFAPKVHVAQKRKVAAGMRVDVHYLPRPGEILSKQKKNLRLRELRTVSTGELSDWITAWSKWAKRQEAAGLNTTTLRWEARQDWSATPIQCAAGSICIYRMQEGIRTAGTAP